VSGYALLYVDLWASLFFYIYLCRLPGASRFYSPRTLPPLPFCADYHFTVPGDFACFSRYAILLPARDCNFAEQFTRRLILHFDCYSRIHPFFTAVTSRCVIRRCLTCRCDFVHRYAASALPAVHYALPIPRDRYLRCDLPAVRCVSFIFLSFCLPAALIRWYGRSACILALRSSFSADYLPVVHVFCHR